MSELRVNKVSSRTGNYVALNTVGMKNIIINGDMSIAQRGTSVTGIGNGDSQYLIDRFYNRVLNGGGWTITQDTDVPTGQGFVKSLKWICTTANASLSANSDARIWQPIEGQNLQYLKKGTSTAESLTVSFWVKSNKTGTYIVELYDNDNARSISKSYIIESASTWEKKTVTFAGDTTGTLDNDNNASLYIQFWLLAGTDYTSGTLQTSWGAYSPTDRAVGQVNLADNTANRWQITGVQLEAGDTASDFEFLPYDLNLLRCQRYCYAYADYGEGNTNDNRQYCARYGGGASFVRIHYPTTMRLEPTTTYTPGGGAVSTDYSNASNFQGYDSDDTGWYVYDFIAEAEL